MDATFFVLDGCLIDSTPTITAAMNKALVMAGLPEQDPDSLVRFVGPPLHDSMEVLLRELGGDQGRAVELITTYREAFGDLSTRMTTVFPGILDVLDELRGRTRLLVVTSKPWPIATPLVDSPSELVALLRA